MLSKAEKLEVLTGDLFWKPISLEMIDLKIKIKLKINLRLYFSGGSRDKAR
jgi:hypothetical protein